MDPKKPPKTLWALTGILAASFVAFLVLQKGFHRVNSLPKSIVSNAPPSSTLAVAKAVGSSPHNVPPQVASAIQAALTQAAAARSREAATDAIDQIVRAIGRMDVQEASRVIREILNSGVDAPTGRPFKVAADGSLEEAPTMRTLLLDLLARLDPKAAAVYARQILNNFGSSDEWALALRNLAKVDTTGSDRTFLEQRMRDLLTYEPWLRDPSVGYLEAFDVAVHLGGTNLLPTLGGLVRARDNQAAAHAAFLALDRLTIGDATTTLLFLSQNPELLQGREETRANYFARVDVRNISERQLLERYLLDSNLSADELRSFTGLFPNANMMISHNLLTRTATPDGAQVRARDEAALRAVQQWLVDPQFTGLRPQLELIQRRLQSFVPQGENLR